MAPLLTQDGPGGVRVTTRPNPVRAVGPHSTPQARVERPSYTAATTADGFSAEIRIEK